MMRKGHENCSTHLPSHNSWQLPNNFHGPSSYTWNIFAAHPRTHGKCSQPTLIVASIFVYSLMHALCDSYCYIQCVDAYYSRNCNTNELKIGVPPIHSNLLLEHRPVHFMHSLHERILTFKTNFHHLHQILIFSTKCHDSPLVQFPPSSQISVNQRSCTTT